MNAKEIVREVLARLPDDCSLNDVLYELYVIEAAQRGLADAAAGRTHAHEQVAAQLRQQSYETRP